MSESETISAAPEKPYKSRLPLATQAAIIARSVIGGETNADVAEALDVDPHTVSRVLSQPEIKQSVEDTKSALAVRLPRSVRVVDYHLNRNSLDAAKFTIRSMGIGADAETKIAVGVSLNFGSDWIGGEVNVFQSYQTPVDSVEFIGEKAETRPGCAADTKVLDVPTRPRSAAKPIDTRSAPDLQTISTRIDDDGSGALLALAGEPERHQVVAPQVVNSKRQRAKNQRHARNERTETCGSPMTDPPGNTPGLARRQRQSPNPQSKLLRKKNKKSIFSKLPESDAVVEVAEFPAVKAEISAAEARRRWDEKKMAAKAELREREKAIICNMMDEIGREMLPGEIRDRLRERGIWMKIGRVIEHLKDARFYRVPQRVGDQSLYGVAAWRTNGEKSGG